MARGKYAARAANTRAENAQQSAAHLADLLAAERLEHSRKVAELNGRVAQLQGRLDKEVKALAAAEIERVTEECRTQIAGERAKLVDRALAVGHVLDRFDVQLPSIGAWADMAEALGVSIGDFLSDKATSRHSRRSDNAKARYVSALKARGLSLAEINAGPPGARSHPVRGE